MTLIRVQSCVLTLHEQHARFRGSVELEQRRIERAADVAAHRPRGRLVRERDELGRRQAHAALQSRTRHDGEIRGIGLHPARRKVAPFPQYPFTLLIGPVRRVGVLVEEQNAVDVAFGYRLTTEVADAGAAGRRRQYGFTILGLLHRPRDACVEAHRFTLLRVPPRPLPNHLQAIGGGAGRREQSHLLPLHGRVQVLILPQQGFRKSLAQVALAERRYLREPRAQRAHISRRRRSIAV
jgi:hypothetical protein